MAKNIVLCLDGTGNQVKASGNTNLLKLYEMLDHSDPTKQVAFYDPGVGTFGAYGAWTPLSRRFTKLMGLAAGYGIKTNLEEAYTYLMGTYEPGDRVFIFGFSRGAFTARMLVGLTYRAGLMRAGAENLVPYLVKSYTKGKDWSGEDWKTVDTFASTFAVSTNKRLSLPVHFLGLWDSVKALGVLRWNPKFPYTRQLPNGATIRHAVSIDEKRRPYEEYLIDPGAKSDLEEAWFAGVHSDVGGTFENDPSLATISLKWMVDAAISNDLFLRDGAYAKACHVEESFATEGTIHRMGWYWALLTYRRRRIASDAKIHSSVRARRNHYPLYRPELDDQTTSWVDQDWTVPRG